MNTIYRTLFANVPFNFRRERLELPDGDFMDLDFSLVNATKVIIALHGLEGSSNSTYIKALTKVANNKGYDVIAVNLRGCSGEKNRLLATYHSGKTEDLQLVIDHVKALDTYTQVHLVGYSLGGNITLKYMGEFAEQMEPTIISAVTISVPCDLEASAIQMNKPSNAIYLKRFLDSMKRKALEKHQEFPTSSLDIQGIKNARTFEDFDNAYTAPAHGFRDASHYWEAASSKSYLASIKKPTLLITALDDPFFTEACYPFEEATTSKHFYFEAPRYGGHVGFRTSLFPQNDLWCENRILEFIEQHS